MANKNVQSQMDTMEVVRTVREDLQREVGTIKNEIMAMNKRLDHLLKMQEEDARVVTSSTKKGRNQPAVFRRFEEKLEESVIGFEGDALLWYQWEHKKRPMVLWEEMKLLILRQFRSTKEGSLHKQFLALRQQRKVKEYRRKFIEFLAPLDNVSDEITLSQFINWLNPEIRNKLRVLDPNNLDRAMDLAQRIESKLLAIGTLKLNGGYSTTKGDGYARPVSVLTGAPRRMNLSFSETLRQLVVAHGFLTPTQTCDEKWSLGHKCKKKELNVLITHDDEDDEELEETSVMVDEPVLKAAEI
ncbi:hypothetical protein Ddye_004822 [Dipteronia dyeriana]|uniref:Retrotransposon gag domain-containing protein n=1 Tax=Dipteronia dyeriana TaxID=168575 RepID=A0AAD9XF48_9ROSI|nr:hypothetical protein Ddye_004822 [Dipteronia dyeriana]